MTGSCAASTSGWEIDAVTGVESERMRAGVEAAWRRHSRALLAAVARAAAGPLRAAESELDRALRRNAELEENARQVRVECQAWMCAATSHEAVAAGLRASLDQLLFQSSSAGGACDCEGEGEAEDARSCCFEATTTMVVSALCKWCGGGEACVVVLPCRHLCLCRACEADVDACPVCAAAKNGSLHVLVS